MLFERLKRPVFLEEIAPEIKEIEARIRAVTAADIFTPDNWPNIRDYLGPNEQTIIQREPVCHDWYVIPLDTTAGCARGFRASGKRFEQATI